MYVYNINIKHFVIASHSVANRNIHKAGGSTGIRVS